jgi:hypothetical protein
VADTGIGILEEQQALVFESLPNRMGKVPADMGARDWV